MSTSGAVFNKANSFYKTMPKEVVEINEFVLRSSQLSFTFYS